MATSFIEDGTALRQWRLRMGLSQRQAAKLCGISKRQWIRWEVGDSPIDHRTKAWCWKWEHHDQHHIEVTHHKNLR